MRLPNRVRVRYPIAGHLPLLVAPCLLSLVSAANGAPPKPRATARLIGPTPRATYYVSQRVKKGLIRLTVDWPEDDRQSLLVRGRIPYGSTFAKIDPWRSRVKKDNTVTFDLGQLPYGEFTAQILAVQRETGKLAGQAAVPFRKLPYRPNEVCISSDRWVIADRRRVLPLVASLGAVPKSLDVLATVPFDAVILPTTKPAAVRTPLRVIPALSGTDVQKLAEPVAEANDLPQLFAWHTARPLPSPAYTNFVKLCPYHPLVVSSPASKAAQCTSADIVAVEPDPPQKGQAMDLAKWAAAIEKLSSWGRCVWASIPPQPSPATMRSACYLALASGAKGIVFQLDAKLDKSKNWPALKAVVTEIAQQRNVFLDSSSVQTLAPKPTGKLRAVAVEHQWRTYILVINLTPTTIKAEIPVSSMEAGRRLWVLGQKRAVQLDADSVLRDSLKPQGALVYTTRPGG